MARTLNTLLLVGGAAAIAAAMLRIRGMRQRPRVRVASTSLAKLRAVEQALDATVEGCSVPSMVANQPVGLEETLQGARNRLRNMLGDEETSSTHTMAVAIENG